MMFGQSGLSAFCLGINKEAAERTGDDWEPVNGLAIGI